MRSMLETLGDVFHWSPEQSMSSVENLAQTCSPPKLADDWSIMRYAIFAFTLLLDYFCASELLPRQARESKTVFRPVRCDGNRFSWHLCRLLKTRSLGFSFGYPDAHKRCEQSCLAFPQVPEHRIRSAPSNPESDVHIQSFYAYRRQRTSRLQYQVKF